MTKPLRLAAAIFLLSTGAGRPLPTDPDTRAWWSITSDLSNDAMAGRDSGSAAYERAARLVALRFAGAGLKPAGDNGTWFQRVPMEELRVTGATIEAGGQPLRFLHDITVTPSPGMPSALDLPIAYRGYCAAAELVDVRGKAVICHGTHRAGLPSDAQRLAAAQAAGAAAVITIADPGFAVEPPRWPYAYARTVWLKGSPPDAGGPVRATLNAAALSTVIARSGRRADQLIADGAAGGPLPSFDASGRFNMRLALAQASISAPNVLGRYLAVTRRLPRKPLSSPPTWTATAPASRLRATAYTTAHSMMPRMWHC